MEARPTTNMEKGWLCRNSYDEKNHEITHMMMTQWWSRSSYDVSEMIQIEWWFRSSSDDPDRAMIQIQWWWPSGDPDRVMIEIQWWWSRSSNDLDSVMILQIEWWSRSSDDVLWWSRSRDDDLKMKMTWRQRRLYDRDDLKTNMIQWYREEDQCWKLCRKNTFLVKRECWCICNFRMYSYMYFIYCNPMFIPGCFYYVFESYCLTPMFRSGGLLM